MRKNKAQKKAVAILTSDWHIWNKAPLARSAEPDWFKAQDRALRAIRRTQKMHGNIPVLVAGDIFDFYNPNPETVNWLLGKMPNNVYAIPGQHDLQNHLYELVGKTGFQTLVEAKKIVSVKPEQPVELAIENSRKKLVIYGRPWNCDVTIKEHGEDDIVILLSHKYIYKDSSTRYEGADKVHNIKNEARVLSNVDIAAYGDNHIPFQAKVEQTNVVNCGTLNRRKVDERGYEVGFYLVYEDLTVDKIVLDTEQDEWAKVVITNISSDKQNARAVELLQELEELDTMSIDFEQETIRYLSDNKYGKTCIDNMIEIFTKYKETAK